MACTARGSAPTSGSAMPWMTAVRPRLPSASVYSDQPTRPSSVVIFRKEKLRQPASACRSSILAIFMAVPPDCSCRQATRIAPRGNHADRGSLWGVGQDDGCRKAFPLLSWPGSPGLPPTSAYPASLHLHLSRYEAHPG